MDFDYFDLEKRPDFTLKGNHAALVALAERTPGCVAVNTNGWLKASIAVSCSLNVH